ncbi:HNH endonuclease family protein [Pectobacterium jejuense]|uniref:TIGR02646 family protein n=1 Tax=Pectobacterium jejuense TaxID=2974022 RepID=A0ABW8H1C2_9GAMM
MIPVVLQAEPDDFEVEVRQKGHNWLKKKGIALNAPPPKASDLPNYWTHSNYSLWESYSGVCAYLAIYFEWVTGASSTDHFVAKSHNAGDAYEWGNYRLSTLGANRNKNDFDDVLDPISLQPDTFVINFASGEISPNYAKYAKGSPYALQAELTLSRLKLDSPEHRKMRTRHFTDYHLEDCSLRYLEKHSPFVYAEIIRQGLTR